LTPSKDEHTPGPSEPLPSARAGSALPGNANPALARLPSTPPRPGRALRRPERAFGAGGFGAIYLAGSAALGGLFIAAAVRLHRQADRASALCLYLYSLAYLAALFAAMVLDART